MNVGPCHQCTVHSRVADGEDDLQIWRVAANILNNQPRKADNGRHSSFGGGRGSNNYSVKKKQLVTKQDLGIGGLLSRQCRNFWFHKRG